MSPALHTIRVSKCPNENIRSYQQIQYLRIGAAATSIISETKYLYFVYYVKHKPTYIYFCCTSRFHLFFNFSSFIHLLNSSALCSLLSFIILFSTLLLCTPDHACPLRRHSPTLSTPLVMFSRRNSGPNLSSKYWSKLSISDNPVGAVKK